MKRRLLLLVAGLASICLPMRAQNSAAELALERKANEERFRTLTARVDNLEETQQLLGRRITTLERSYSDLSREIDKIKEDVAQGSTRQVSREELKTLVEKLQEIDKKREADKKLILETFKDLAKLPAAASTSPKPVPERNEVGETYDYVVQPGDQLRSIINDYNGEYAKQGLGRITLDQVKRANPDINIDRILPKQVIRIPVPPKK